jgi:DNA-directed RNA polymerase beta' subunit
MHKEVGPQGVGPERLAVYHALKAVAGLGDPVTAKSKQKRVHGVLHSVFGSSPKFGYMQRKLLSHTVDNVGRGVVIPNPDLDMDTLGLPEDKAFDVYGRFVARRLRRQGMDLREALLNVKDRSPLAKKMLEEEIVDRPVYINRSPVLHRFGIMAFRPRLIAGNVLHVSPMVLKGFNMDFDGDTANFHVPTTEEARKEALEKMLPSRNLLSPADFKTPVHFGTQEYQGGLHRLSTARSGRRPRVFRNTQDVVDAYKRGDIALEDAVQILRP